MSLHVNKRKLGDYIATGDSSICVDGSSISNNKTAKETLISDINNGFEMLLRPRSYCKETKTVKFQLSDSDYRRDGHGDKMDVNSLNTQMESFIKDSSTIITNKVYIEYDKGSGNYNLCMKMRKRGKACRNGSYDYM